MSGHTPGPWQVGFSDGSGANDEDGYCIVAGDHAARTDVTGVVTVVLAGIDHWGVVRGIANADDARLIASAPDLLAALKEAADYTRHPDYDWPVEFSRQVSAAIAKAEGAA